MSRSAWSVHGVVGAGVLVGAMLAGPLAPAQAMSPATGTQRDVKNVVGMDWHMAPLPEGGWHGGGNWGHHWFWGNNGWHGRGHW